MHEGLGNVSSELSFPDVELLGEQARGTARCPVPLEPGDGCLTSALIEVRQSQRKAAQGEGAFGILEGSIVVPESIEIAVLAQLLFDGGDGGDHAGILEVDRSPGG